MESGSGRGGSEVPGWYDADGCIDMASHKYIVRCHMQEMSARKREAPKCEGKSPNGWSGIAARSRDGGAAPPWEREAAQSESKSSREWSEIAERHYCGISRRRRAKVGARRAKMGALILSTRPLI